MAWQTPGSPATNRTGWGNLTRPWRLFPLVLIGFLCGRAESRGAGADDPATRSRVLLVKPVVLCDDDGTSPARSALPKTLIDRAYTKADVELLYLAPVLWPNGPGRRGELALDRLIQQGRQQGVIAADRRVVTLLFVSSISGQAGPQGLQKGNVCCLCLGPAGQVAVPAERAALVARELGRCLGLQDAADDPRLPAGMPNVRGEAPGVERLAVLGLHDSQRDRVLRSPLVLARVRAHSLDEARALLVDDSWEPYLAGATNVMLRFTFGLKADAAIPATAAERNAFVRSGHAAMAEEFSDKEVATLRRCVARLSQVAGRDWPALTRLPWHFIKVQGNFCNGFPHTRGLAIVLTGGVLEEIAGDEVRGLTLLAHEKLHIVQRLNTLSFAGLYQEYGFLPVQLAPGEPARLNFVQNPDALRSDWAVRPGGQWLLLATTFRKNRNLRLGFQESCFPLEQRTDGLWSLAPEIDPPAALREWKSSFPISHSHDHPHEVAAYILELLLRKEYLGESLRPLSAEQEQRYRQTQTALTRHLQLAGE